MSPLRNPATRNDPLLAEFDRIGLGERERARAKAQYLQIEAVIERVWSLGAALARSVHGARH